MQRLLILMALSVVLFTIAVLAFIVALLPDSLEKDQLLKQLKELTDQIDTILTT